MQWAISIARQSKNGIAEPLSYVLAETILVSHFVTIQVFALAVPAFDIQGFPHEVYKKTLILWMLFYISSNASLNALLFGFLTQS
jgi:hypothetical protein